MCIEFWAKTIGRGPSNARHLRRRAAFEGAPVPAGAGAFLKAPAAPARARQGEAPAAVARGDRDTAATLQQASDGGCLTRSCPWLMTLGQRPEGAELSYFFTRAVSSGL
jgi:hypothetical protein